jgi:hypothetical protein
MVQASITREIPVDLLDGRRRTLKFNHYAIACFEEEAGEDFAALSKNPKRFEGFRIQLLLLWAGLLHEHPGLSPSQAAGMLDNYVGKGGAKEKIVESVSQALQASPVFERNEPEEEKGGAVPGKDGAPASTPQSQQ